MQSNIKVSVVCIAATFLASCSEKTPPNVVAPGADETPKTKLLEAGADMLQNKTPLRKLDAYLDGFHFYNGNLTAQMEAHHYCGHLNEDFIQCVIFDGNGENAKIMGVEYIISSALFQTLEKEEKHFWHSHAHEVRSGQLIAPGIPDIAEHELMEKIAGTYGKTWHTWHTDEQLMLPTGTPMLMMGFTQDGQANERMVADRDARFGISSDEKRMQRSDIRYPLVDTDADSWQKGVAPQIGVVPRH
jgi:Protein of unknown function (DUF1264)